MEEVKASIDESDYDILSTKDPNVVKNAILATIFLTLSLWLDHNSIISSIVYFLAILFSISLLLSIKKKIIPDMWISKKGIIFQQNMVEHLIIAYKDIDKIVEKGQGISIFTKDKIYRTDFLKNKFTFLNQLERMFSKKSV